MPTGRVGVGGQWIAEGDTPADRGVLTAQQYAALVAPGDLSGVIYDTQSRVIQFAVDGVRYDIDWPNGRINSSDGMSKLFTIDPNGRFTSVTLEV